jgi:hypothetical protein
MALGDNYVEVTAVGIQGLSTTGTVVIVPGATGSTGPVGASGLQGASGLGGAAAITIVGSVATSTDLNPSYSGAAGDGYITVDTGHVWVWDGASWIDAGAIAGASGAGGNGATGPRGATGLSGASGIAGASGSAGSQGASGVGASGIHGASGIGATGIQGPAGASGVGGAGSGATGASGTAGASGISGASGTAGASGISGASGYIGHDGATGTQGASGSTGLTGATGVGGSVSQWEALPKSYNQYDIVSFQGNLYYWVSASPGNSTSNPSIDTISWQVATGSGNGATGATGVSNVAGATGTQGASGINGSTGVQGIQGASGATGYQGASGSTGLTGASGYVGHDGATGIQGSDGASGPQGSTGIRGASGSTGLTGATGAAGVAGASGAGAAIQASFTTSSTAETIVDVIDTSLIRSAKYDMQESSGSSYSASELRFLHDGPYVFLTQYASIGDSLGTFNTFFSPTTNNYSSPDINNGGMSYWNGATVRIYTTNEAIQQALLSIVPTTVVSLNSGAYTVTASTKCVEISAGIYQFTVTPSRSPILLLSNLSWTGTGFCELRYTPNNAVTTLKYLRTTIS